MKPRGLLIVTGLMASVSALACSMQKSADVAAAGETSAIKVRLQPVTVLQHHNGDRREGVYFDAAFTKTAIASAHLDTGFNAPVMGTIYAQPLFVPADSTESTKSADVELAVPPDAIGPRFVSAVGNWP